MSGGEKPALTDDEARVQIQMSQTEISRISASMAPGASAGGGAGPFGSTSFEGRELNAMIDLVDSANHTDLENAGSALWKARDALKEAARELKGYIDEVEWQGESGAAFKDFGTRLTKHAVSLADFADVAGTQITVAGTGLASVRSSMPARDGRMIKKKVEDIPLPGRIDGNADYTAAVKVEKDRQEAINQMYRLASFYAVSEERLAAQEPPVFDAEAPGRVPRPVTSIETRPNASGTAASGGLSGVTTSRAVASHTELNGAGDAPHRNLSQTAPDRAAAVDAGPESAGVMPGREPSLLPERDVSLEINSAMAPPVSHAGSSAAPISSSPGSAGSGSASGFAPPFVSNVVNPAQGGAPRVVGPAAAPGAAARPMGAGSGAAGASPVSGRPGATAPGGPRAGRAEGVVGGSPRSAGGSSAPRLPRGTVVGGDGAAPSRGVAGRAGQPGAVGANPAKGAVRPGGRGTASSNGVVGTPRGGASGSRSRGGGFTQGGAGLVRGPGRKSSGKEEQEPAGSSRPEYLTEDEETWTGRRHGVVPPVVE